MKIRLENSVKCSVAKSHAKDNKIPLLDLPDSVSPVPRKAIAKKTPTPVATPKVLSEKDWEM